MPNQPLAWLGVTGEAGWGGTIGVAMVGVLQNFQDEVSLEVFTASGLVKIVELRRYGIHLGLIIIVLDRGVSKALV